MTAQIHPSISHINADQNLSEETILAINSMFDRVLEMEDEQLKNERK